MTMTNEKLMNTLICYLDFLGEEHRGKVVYLEGHPSLEEGVFLAYIFDEDDNMNDKEKTLENGSSFRYADIRLTTELYI